MLNSILVYLICAVVVVPFAKALGLGSVLGYLVAGILVGPRVFALIYDAQGILHFSEFGVVMLMFLIGLELNPKRLWTLRHLLFGLGTLQFVLTSLCLAVAAHWWLGWDWVQCTVAGIGLSLSSTAIAMQVIKERNEGSTPAGQSSFAVLLFQDLAVIPVLALLPLWARPGAQGASTVGATSLQGWGAVLVPFVTIVVIIVLGRKGLRILFRFVARAEVREVFTSCALLLVLGIALIMEAVGLSMALGSFLAGLLLADSEYRHELESHIEPFKGLLLGLFFLAVGMSIEFVSFVSHPLRLVTIVVFVLLVKIGILVFLGRFFKLHNGQNFLLAALLAQGSEFAFVLGSMGGHLGILGAAAQNELNSVVACSMMLSPLFVVFYEKILSPRFARLGAPPVAEWSHQGAPVLVAGFGRMGQIIARLLHASKIQTTVIDHNPDHIERVRRFGFKAFYGDATNKDLLVAAGLEQAKVLVLAIDDREASLKVIDIVAQGFPHVKIVARAWDMIHVYALLDRGISHFERETFDASLSMGEQVLRLLGMRAFSAKRAASRFKRYDLQAVQRLHAVHKDDKQFASLARQSRQELEKLFETDETTLVKNQAEGWSQS